MCNQYKKCKTCVFELLDYCNVHKICIVPDVEFECSYYTESEVFEDE